MGEGTSLCADACVALGAPTRAATVALRSSPLPPAGSAGQLRRAARLDDGQHSAAAFHAITDLQSNRGAGIEDHVGARSKLDHSNAFAPLDTVADGLIEHNPPREEAGDLFHDDRLPVVAGDCDDVLFVHVCRLA